MSWEALVTAFLAELRPRQKRRTTQSRAFWLRSFLRFCREHSVERADIGPWHIEAFQGALVWTPGPSGRLYAPNTVDQAMRMLRTFMRWAAAHGHIPRNPAQGLVLPDAPCRPVPRLSPEEVARLLQGASARDPRGWRDRAILETLVDTALRVPDLVRLDLEHVDLAQARLKLKAGALPLGSSLVAALDRYLRWGRPLLCDREPEALFLSQRGRLTGRTILEMVRTYAGRAGLEWVTPRILAQAGRGLEDSRWTWPS